MCWVCVVFHIMYVLTLPNSRLLTCELVPNKTSRFVQDEVTPGKALYESHSFLPYRSLSTRDTVYELHHFLPYHQPSINKTTYESHPIPSSTDQLSALATGRHAHRSQSIPEGRFSIICTHPQLSSHSPPRAPGSIHRHTPKSVNMEILVFSKANRRVGRCGER